MHMRIAWMKMGGLWPLNTGGRQRSFQILSALARRHQLTLVTTHGRDDDPAGLARALPHAEAVVSVPYQVAKHGEPRFLATLAASWATTAPVDLWKWRVGRFRREVARVLAAGTFDTVIVDFLFADANLTRRDIPVVFFSHNVEYLIWKRLADIERRPWRKAILEIEWRKMRRSEGRTVRRADATVAVSDADRRLFLADAPDAAIEIIRTGVDTTYFAPGGAAEIPGRLVFSGSMDWYPNEDAIAYFSERLLPRLKHARPDVALTVVGRNPGSSLRETATRAGIALTGTVDDVRPFIDEGSVYIVPLRIGGGTRLKILEALAMAKPVVSTTLGAEGLTLAPDRHYIAADGDERFADAVLALLADAPARRRLGQQGRQLVVDEHSWDRVAREFELTLATAMRNHYASGRYAEGRVAVSSR
jgi:glycosyltransferase involved in cell wall biosynthesis